MGKNQRPCTWNGINYPSLESCAEANEVTAQTMWLRLEKGMSCDNDLNEIFNPKPCTWEGIEYPSYSQAAIAHGESVMNISRWIKEGATCFDDLKPYTWQGKLWKSGGEISRALGVPVSTIGAWLRNGYTCIEDVPTYACTINGVFYKTNSDAASALGLSRELIRQQVAKRGKNLSYNPSHRLRQRWKKVSEEPENEHGS